MCVLRRQRVALEKREPQMNMLHNEPEIAPTALATDARDSATATQPGRIEAYGVKGMKSRPWRRTFKDADALMTWGEKNDAQFYAQRFVDGQ
jgi:hypothetical protein